MKPGESVYGNGPTKGATVWAALLCVLLSTAAAQAQSSTPRPAFPTTNGTVYAMALEGNILYIGGHFTTVGGQTRNRLAAIDVTSNTVTNWNPNANSDVRALAVSGGTVYAGGAFTFIGGQTRNRIAALNSSDGLATTWNPNANSSVLALVVSGSTVYAGGSFTTIGGQSRNSIATLNTSNGLATAWNPNANNTVWTLAVQGSTVYAGGGFTSIGGQPRNSIAALNTSNGLATAWNPSANNWVYSLAISGSTVYAGGGFTSIGGPTRIGIAALNTSNGLATAWNPNANNTVWTLAVSGSTVYAGGHFTTIGGQTRNRIAALNTSNGLATAWNPNANSSVHALAVSGSTVYAGGGFTTIGGQPRIGIAAFDFPLPDPPSAPSATGITPNQITWTWQDNSGDETGFKVFADPGSSAPTTLRTTTAANTTSWNYTGLTPNTQYAFQVAATNGAGDSAKTTLITRRTLAATPLAPALGNPTGDTLEVSIAAGDGNPAGTQYALRETGSGLWVQTNGSLGASAVFRSSTAWDVTTVTGLSEATAYSFMARARNNVDLIETADSPPANLSTLDVTAPTVLSITPATTGPTNADAIDFEIVFDEAVQNFDDVSDLEITHSGTAHTGASFSGSGDSYTVAVEGLSGDGSFTVAVSLTSDVEDLSGNGLASSPTSDAVFLDNTPPEATLSSVAGAFVNGPIAVTITLSETASDFVEGDWDLDNATASDFAGSGTDYSLTLTAQSEGSFGMSLPAGVFTDAAGNGNLPSAALSRSYDVSSPSFSNIVATPAEASAGMEVVITFDSSEALLAPAEVTVNGHPTTATLKSGSSASYVVSETEPLGAATIVISGFDLAGNLGTESNDTALMILSAEPEVPVGGLLPLAIFLGLFGAAALRRRT